MLEANLTKGSHHIYLSSEIWTFERRSWCWCWSWCWCRCWCWGLWFSQSTRCLGLFCVWCTDLTWLSIHWHFWKYKQVWWDHMSTKMGREYRPSQGHLRWATNFQKADNHTSKACIFVPRVKTDWLWTIQLLMFKYCDREGQRHCQLASSKNEKKEFPALLFWPQFVQEPAWLCLILCSYRST